MYERIPTAMDDPTLQTPDRVLEDGRVVSLTPAPSDRLDLLDVALIVAEHKERVLKGTLIAALVATVIALLLPNVYQSETRIMAPQQSPSFASAMLGNLQALSSLSGAAAQLGLQDSNDVYIAMLESRGVADNIIRQFNLQKVYKDKTLSDTRQDLEKHRWFESAKGETITIRVEDRDPRSAAAMANAYVEQLRATTREIAANDAVERRRFFEQQFHDTGKLLSASEDALLKVSAKTGVIALDEQARGVVNAYALLQAQVAAKEVEIRALQSFAAPHNPDLVRAQQELAELQDQLGKLERSTGSAPGDPLIPTTKLPVAGIEYVRRLREVKFYENLAGLLAQQTAAARVDETATAPSIDILDLAVPAEKKSGPHRALIVLLTAFAAAFLMASFFIVQDIFERMVRDRQAGEKIEALRRSLVFRGPERLKWRWWKS
jgi:tyrosine-protein kinase Etk/Wzc